ncbi:hypothetical protein E0504_44430 [Parafrankia sp. BMG5.11]|nr:hypothetical protein E0504_44430 [Parafrankia sp. BMG5.11]
MGNDALRFRSYWLWDAPSQVQGEAAGALRLLRRTAHRLVNRDMKAAASVAAFFVADNWKSLARGPAGKFTPTNSHPARYSPKPEKMFCEHRCEPKPQILKLSVRSRDFAAAVLHQTVRSRIQEGPADMIVLRHRLMLAASAIGAAMYLSSPVQARECLLDTNNDGTATAGVDSDGGAASTNTQDTACGVAAVATSTGSTVDTQDTDGATAFGALSLAVGLDTVAVGNDAIAGVVSAGNVTAADRATALGASSLSSGAQATSVGYRASALGASATAIGANARAVTAEVTAVGASSSAQGERTTALGANSSAGSLQSIAVGYNAQATAFKSIAIGANAVSTSQGVAIGDAAIASGPRSTVVGESSTANGADALVFGSNTLATGNGAMSVGARSSANGVNATAIGYAASAQQAGATAVGTGATTTAANQVTLGATGSSVRIGDIAASTAAQSGPVQAVTVDANGTLGRQAVATTAALNEVSTRMISALAVTDSQFADLSNRVGNLENRLDAMSGEMRGGIAAAMALGGTMVAPDSTISMSFNLATYRGEQGYSGAIVGRVAPRVYVSAGVAGSTAKSSTGGRVGVTFGL